jgi:hypothetical protein
MKTQPSGRSAEGARCNSLGQRRPDRLCRAQCGEACLIELEQNLRLRLKLMFLISSDSPAYYLTSVTKDRLNVFRLDTLKSVACNALAEARVSGGFLILAYVIMPDHISDL